MDTFQFLSCKLSCCSTSNKNPASSHITRIMQRQTFRISSDISFLEKMYLAITCREWGLKNKVVEERALGCFSPTPLKGSVLHSTHSLLFLISPRATFLPNVIYLVSITASSPGAQLHSPLWKWGAAEQNQGAVCKPKHIQKLKRIISEFSSLFHSAILLISTPKLPSLLPIWPNNTRNFILFQEGHRKAAPTSPRYSEWQIHKFLTLHLLACSSQPAALS